MQDRNGGYLAVFVAAYEPDMGVEFAQFPAKDYTDNYRTDVLHYALSKDGKRYEKLNHGKGVFYPEELYQFGSPSLFRKADGRYGLVASVNNSNSQVLLYDSDDLIFFENRRIVSLNDSGITVTNPMVEYSEEQQSYLILWEGTDGCSYCNRSKDLLVFGEAQTADYKKPAVIGEIPEYALKEEASVFPLTEEEYERIQHKFGRITCVRVAVSEEIQQKQNEKIQLPKTVDVCYSDGSRTAMKVLWEKNSIPVDAKGLPKPGTYTVRGRIATTTVYHSPLALYRADPCVTYDERKSCYYLTGSNLNENSANGGGAYQNIIIRKADSINGLTAAEEYIIWKDTEWEDGVKVTGWYWAPELHFIDGKWRVLALATVTDEISKRDWRECIFTCYGDDVTDAANWKYDGYILPATDGQWLGAFDTTYFEWKGQSYYVSPKDSKIWITTVDPKDLNHPTGPLVRLSAADRGYESNIGAGKKFNMPATKQGAMGQQIQEASAVLIHDGKIFIAYAGCTVDMHYCVCLLYADADSDLMNPKSWKKYPYPVLSTADITTTVKRADYTKVAGEESASGLQVEGKYQGTFGPGHNFFTVDESGNPVIIYHARDWDNSYPGAIGDEKYGLVDPGRHAYAAGVHFGADGFPICNMKPEELLDEKLREVSIKVVISG